MTERSRKKRKVDESSDLEEARPAVRPRRNSSLDEDASGSETQKSPAIRDPQFYKADGNCVLRVDNTLFRVHRHYLAPEHEQSVFGGLFALPTGPEAVEGERDEAPIVLQGDTVDELRAFFRFAYSSPLQLQADAMSDDDLVPLMLTAKFADKYRLESFEKWARNTILHLTARNNGQALKACAPKVYVELLLLNNLSPDSTTEERVRDAWMARIRRGELPIAHALGVTETLNMRSFLGELYYEQLRALDPAALAPSCTAPVRFDAPGLSDAQKIRLLAGHRSLSLAWARIVEKLLALPLCTASTCPMRASAQTSWRTAVHRTATATDTDLAVFARLKGLERGLLRMDTLCSSAQEAAQKALASIRRRLASSLADHFLGPAEPA
ncbi:hypothetical protein GGX14DRAFT_478204 [Mycena pura]|uniref:BTB domain-containing protein n=1 Tax=Mycena pura TaxID=153505 RepID=A0AAD6Y2G5_9AGAR|nr:hypothetical protein GGX14DRAFT_478204 [Mycena pura]